MEKISRNIEKSLAMQKKAAALIPGMTQLLSKRPDMFSYGAWPGYYSRAEGCTVWDLDGNRYTDMSIAGIGANIPGYAVPEVDDAVRRAIAAGSSSSLNCPEEVELAELLCELHPWAHMARSPRGGGESMALAVRIARIPAATALLSAAITAGTTGIRRQRRHRRCAGRPFAERSQPGRRSAGTQRNRAVAPLQPAGRTGRHRGKISRRTGRHCDGADPQFAAGSRLF